ncbi:hypothetical protein TSUD_239850 [Trifolium subterraneum]|uniref:RNase H type-1 domain-containing protein n=1 Tax=Trifolium subterraneum TaxID=3900 RepID=A0A2Z6NS61_TRISU|nr:hypothetical protein TSUD_239850 [Trifolium subterraneum]
MKCNIDGAAKGNTGLAGCGGVFRNHEANLLYYFAEPLGFFTSFQAELSAAISAIEVAFRFNWHNLWIETDSTLVVRAFQNHSYVVTWNLRNKWTNALFLFKQLNGIVSHIFREGNQVADSLANYGCTLTSSSSCHQAPGFIRYGSEKNKLGFPSFRIYS